MSPTLTFPAWLGLREPADAAARSDDLVETLRARLPSGELVVHDLGCGTGSMARWLSPRLPLPQQWVLYDRDADLLGLAAEHPPAGRVETRRRDVTRLEPGDLATASLVTASALLDMFTADELDRFVATCAAAGCPTLVALSVTGRVRLDPSDPLDEVVAAAFNDHQRRTTGAGPLLGPDAVRAAATAFEHRGHDVVLRPSPWRLGPDQVDLMVAWFDGWVRAACEQRPDLTGPVSAYTSRRMAQAADGRLSVTVHHADLLALPR